MQLSICTLSVPMREKGAAAQAAPRHEGPPRWCDFLDVALILVGTLIVVVLASCAPIQQTYRRLYIDERMELELEYIDDNTPEGREWVDKFESMYTPKGPGWIGGPVVSHGADESLLPKEPEDE